MHDLTSNYSWNPFRKPDWKWQLANEIHEGKLKRGNFHDPVIGSAVDNLAGEGSGHTHRCIEEAKKLYTSNAPRRWTIEALLLAGVSFEEIGEATHIEPKVIEWFEALFFNVQDRLQATDYLMTNVVGFGHLKGFKDSDVRSFWLWVAMSKAPLIVDMVIKSLPRPKRSRPPRLSDYFKPRSQLPKNIQAFVAINVLPNDETTALFFVWLKSQTDLDVTFMQQTTIEAARCFLSGRPLPGPAPQSDQPVDESPAKSAVVQRKLYTMLNKADPS